MHEKVTDFDELEPLNLTFRDSNYSCTTIGSTHPRRVLNSYMAEGRIREVWWNIQPDDIVMDVGAAYGSWTIPALVKGAIVVAVEPDRDCVFDFLTNLTINGLLTNCSICNVTVGCRNGVIAYSPEHHSCVRLSPTSSEHRVQLTVDAIASNMTRLDWMKIDVEGAEVLVLEGALETIKRTRPKIVVEYHPQWFPNIFNEVRAILDPLDYTEECIVEGMSRWTPNEK